MDRTKKHGMGGWSGKRGEGQGIKFLRAHLNYAGDDCLIWPLSCDDKGYGILSFEGTRSKAHRLMCRLASGEPPTPSHQAAHTCGNGDKGCVNPRHLIWKTNSQNQHERTAHGRRTLEHNRRKLTSAQKIEVQALRGVKTIREIAATFGIKRGTVDYYHRKARDRAAAR